MYRKGFSGRTENKIMKITVYTFLYHERARKPCHKHFENKLLGEWADLMLELSSRKPRLETGLQMSQDKSVHNYTAVGSKQNPYLSEIALLSKCHDEVAEYQDRYACQGSVEFSPGFS